MKIALVLDGLQVGGVERVCLDYCKLLLDLGYKVTIFNLRPNLTALEKEIPEGVKIVHIPFSIWFTPERYTKLVKWNFIYKLVYFFAYIIFSCIDVVYKGYCKLRYKECRENFDFAVSFSSHFNDLTFVADHFIKAKNTVSWSHGAIYSYLLMSDGFINLYNKIKNIVVLVDDAQEEVLSYNQNLHLNIYKLYNPSFVKSRPVDNNKVEELKRKYGKFILMVSRFKYPHKDQPTVIRAFDDFITNYKLNTNLVFIGDGPDKDQSEKIANNLSSNVRKRIHFLGTKLDVQNYYSAAYVLVHASVAGEGLPTIMIEAMNYGIPEVVTDSKTGPREILGDNQYGLLCKVQNPKDMSKKLFKLFSDENLYKHYQSIERERVKDFSPKVIEKNLDYILKDINKRGEKAK